MAIDPMMLDAVLNTFRGMSQEIESKGMSGEDVDKMNEALARMEELGQTLDDFNEYNGLVMQENLYGKFSDHYGKALASGAQADQEKTGYDDASLLNQSLNALKDAVKRLRDSKQEAIDEANSHSDSKSAKAGFEFLERNADKYGVDTSASFYQGKKNEALENAEKSDEQNAAKRKELFQTEIDALYDNEALIKPIEGLIELGEQDGMTLPRFLRIQIEKGLDKAMEGTAVVRDGLHYDIKMAKASMVNPFEIEQKNRNLEVFESLAANAKFGVPNSLEVTLAQNKIEWELEPKKIYWGELKVRMFRIIGYLESIVIANSSVFPSYAPYIMMDTHSAKVEHAEFVKNCIPGICKEEERLMKKYFGLEFNDIFSHEIFKWEVENFHIDYSQMYIEFLKNEVYPEVIPCEFLSSSTISIFENEFHNKSTMANPEAHKAWDRMTDAMDEHFGEGYSDKKLGKSDFPEQNAPNWELSSLK